MTTPKPQRIAKVIAASGLCSRREAERWLDVGRVTLNGDIILTAAQTVTDADVITVDGKPLKQKLTPRLFAFYKPTDVLVTSSDPQGRTIIYDILPKIKNCTDRLIPVGRLDINSEGLLLLSNDPKRVTKLMHSNLPRTYRVRTFGQLTPAQEAQVRAGITYEGIQYAPAKLKLDKVSGRNAWYILTLTEGKNREIRNIFRHFDIQVNKLIRTQYGDIKLGDLERGQLREVPIEVV